MMVDTFWKMCIYLSGALTTFEMKKTVIGMVSKIWS